MATATERMSAVVVRAQERWLALALDDVLELVLMPPVSRMPSSAPHVRGVANFRGRVLPVVDLRLRLGLPSLADEVAALLALLQQREDDHLRWLDELEQSVSQRRTFRLAVDPHQCAFGKWYDTYQTSNVTLGFMLRRSEEPHRALHAVAAVCQQLLDRGRPDEAARIITRARTMELSAMVKLFTEVRAVLRDTHREVAVVMRTRPSVVVAVDAVELVGQLELTDAEGASSVVSSELISGVARRTAGRELIGVVRTHCLLVDDHGAPVSRVDAGTSP